MPLVALGLCLLLIFISDCSDGNPTGAEPTAINIWVPGNRERVIGTVSRQDDALSSNILEQPSGSLTAAVQQADSIIRRGRLNGDPKFYGRAEALLAPWYTESATAHVRVLMATILQRRHDFSAALQELSVAIEQQPDNAQAWLSQALIQRASGDLAAAARSCASLRHLAQPLVAFACELSAAGDMETVSRTYRAFVWLLDNNPPADIASRQWLQRTAATAALSRGQLQRAESYFRQALALTPEAPDLHAEWLDFLLDQKRFREAEAHLQTIAFTQQHDGLLLRRAIVAKQLGWPSWRDDLQLLQQRQALLQQRGDGNLHLREQARQMLELEALPGRALALALDNWRLQREVADARLVLEAALQLQRPAAAIEVMDWMREQQVRHPQLQQLANQLEKTSW